MAKYLSKINNTLVCLSIASPTLNKTKYDNIFRIFPSEIFKFESVNGQTDDGQMAEHYW